MALISTNVNAKLLVVDDDDLVRGWLIEALEAEGFALEGVNSAEEPCPACNPAAGRWY